jgi:hypothetical protein
LGGIASDALASRPLLVGVAGERLSGRDAAKSRTATPAKPAWPLGGIASDALASRPLLVGVASERLSAAAPAKSPGL